VPDVLLGEQALDLLGICMQDGEEGRCVILLRFLCSTESIHPGLLVLLDPLVVRWRSDLASLVRGRTELPDMLQAPAN
jgi:hypothetical protein